MTKLFDSGCYDEAAIVYEENANAASVPLAAELLRARIFMRKPGQMPKALALLNRVEKPKGGPDRVLLEMTLGEAYAASEDVQAADRRLAEAMKIAESLGDKRLISEVAYRFGRRYAVFAHDPEKARVYLSIVRRGGSVDSRLNAFHLESWILSREQRPLDQARVLIELLSQLDPMSQSHMEHRVRATQTLAALVREMYIPEAVGTVERHLGGVSWPQDFAVAEFQTLKALGWAKALQGDYFNAFRLLRRSTDSAPDAAWRAVALCDRAYLAKVRNQELWFRQELSDAEEAAALVDWEHHEDESCVALLLLAELSAPHNAAQASEYLARFRGLAGLRNPRSMLRRDPRFEAMVDYSSGVVDIALGDKRLGGSRLKTALKVYQGAGFLWRAARTALRLYEVTHQDRYLDDAVAWLEHYRLSWLEEELRAKAQAEGRGSGLSPMREKVFRLLCEGKTNNDIAEVLGISAATVANHAKAVLKAFNVNSRHALIAKALKMGLI